jgi:crotonobetainyl-CoA:carnitine CoA-transferase CaiB-like acyl-CoA transferase
VLSPYRVLDLSDDRGQFAGLILAQLGADVIVVEPPDGSPSRRRGPYAGARSLSWEAWNRGKRSVVVDRATDTGRDLLVRLASAADVLVESEPPGVLAAAGLGYDDLAAGNPGLVYVSITAFGVGGPKASWAATDLTVWAAAGPHALAGDRDRAPLRVPGGQAFLHAAGDAAGGAIAALLERARSGRGQHVTVSAQRSATMATQAQILNVAYHDQITERSAGGSAWGQLVNRYLYPALDGHVSVTLGFGSAVGPFTTRLVAWLYEEGFCDEATRDKDWPGFAARLQSGDEPLSEHERIKDLVARFTATKSKANLFSEAMRRKVLIAPVATISDLLASEQLRNRRFWDDIEGARCPGRWAEIVPIALHRLAPAPALGEHTEEVVAGVSGRPPKPAARPTSRTSALEGLKVLDFTWSMAGPVTIRPLADLGATVIRVESRLHADTARTLRPFDRRVTPPLSGAFADFNAGKLGLSLNLGRPRALEVAGDLCQWADVVCESFSPGTMASWGLDYETLRRTRPDLVMLSSSLMGQTGPLARYVGFGNTGASLAGFTHLTGWPDRDPAGPYSAYSDYVSPRLALAAVLAAVDHRRRTGEGSYIDLSQTAAALMYLTPAVLQQTMGGEAPAPMGNADHDFVPHGVYPVAGDDHWVAIVCCDDDQWGALAAVAGGSDLAGLGLGERRRREAELDKVIAEWTITRPGDGIEAACQAARIAAHVVQNSAECWADPQLWQQGHFREVPHPAVAEGVWVQGPRIDLSATPADVAWAGPELGQHSWHVLEDILGYDADRIVELYADGALD